MGSSFEVHSNRTLRLEALNIATIISGKEALAQDQVRLHPTNNTLMISTPEEARHGAYAQIMSIRIGTRATDVTAYVAPPDHPVRGVLHMAHSDLPPDVNDHLRNTTKKCEEMFPQSVASLSDHRNNECLKQVAGPKANEQRPRDVFCAQRGLFQPYIDCVMKTQRDMMKAYAKLSATELRAVRDGLVCMLTTWNELLRT
ncbi:uncharacterized protein [Dermacentor albipictus]|uniref:uncharacterized protein isoform X1 n=1 Tax=Dermacentor albipictus TaxID=60249 RepID=UPI0038FCD5F7